MGFDFQAAFRCPVKLINDAAMQALGSYEGGKNALPGSWHGTWFCLGGGRDPAAPGARSLPYKKGHSKITLGSEDWSARANKMRSYVEDIVAD